MPLLFNLHHVEIKNLRLVGELPVLELELEGVDELIHLRRPLQYDLELQKLPDGILAQGSLRLALDCECIRCLKPFERELRLDRWACHLALEGEGKAPIINDCVDLTPYLREDILLGFPQHPLCKPECSGLPEKRSSKNQKPGGKRKAVASSAWTVLDKLKL